MSDHTTALVPIETWAFQSPAVHCAGGPVDVGLLAESLIYYDSVLFNVASQPQFAALLQWFIHQDALNEFFALVTDGTIRVYDYAFLSTAVQKDDEYILLNIQDPLQAKPNTFNQRFLYHRDIANVLRSGRLRERLYKAFRDRVVEVKADAFGAAIKNASADHESAERSALVLQAFVDDVYEFRQLGHPPRVQAEVVQHGDKLTVTYNVDLAELSKLAGNGLNFGRGTPLTGSVLANRFIWSAADQGCDLYVSSPMSSLIGDKLFEADRSVDKTRGLITKLEEAVEFPDIRALVNSGKLPFREILRIRNKAGRFRKWLQDEAGRERDALIAYHHEVSREAGLLSYGRKALSIVGMVGSAAAGGALGVLAASPAMGALVGAAAGTGGYLLDIGSRLGADWKPVVFGTWIKERVAKSLGD